MSTLVHDAPQLPVRDAAPTSLRTILIHVQADKEARARLQAAVALARRYDATLFGLAAETIPPLGALDPTGMVEGAWYAEMREEVQKNLELSREAFREATRDLKTDFAWVQDMPDLALARASRAADLILIGGCAADGGDRYRHCDAAELMLQAGRPVLIAPRSGAALDGRAVVVAWKDSRESRRALADALPFLQRAEAVQVVEVCDRDDLVDAEMRTRSVVAGLKRHGVAAEARVAAASPDRVVDELEAAAKALGADLIVAGGYGHSRLGEWVFGGVTRDLLRQSRRYVLLSH